MVSAVTCQSCGAHVDAQYARVFGNEDTQVHACRNCSTQGAIAKGAAVDANRDGTRLVHRPGIDEPVPAVFHETDSDTDADEDRLTLEEIREWPVTIQDSTTDHRDDAFAALVAE